MREAADSNLVVVRVDVAKELTTSEANESNHLGNSRLFASWEKTEAHGYKQVVRTFCLLASPTRVSGLIISAGTFSI